jgi:uncharacterized protein YecT (DUF1311 family)
MVKRPPKRALSLALALVAWGGGASAVSVEAYYSPTYKACMDEAAGSTYPTRDCIAAEHASWDKALNQIYRTLMQSRSPAEKTELRDDERGWLRRTKVKCDHAGDDEAGGTLQLVEVDQCFLDATIERAVYLRGLH